MIILQIITLFIMLAFAGHLYVEIDKMIKQADLHIAKLDKSIDEYIAKREAESDAFMAEINSYE